MRKSIYAILSAMVIAAAPLAPAFAQASDVPAKCAQLTDAQAKAECIQSEKGGK